MAFRYLFTLCVVLATAQAGVLLANPSVDAVASTQQNVVRSFDGTVSSYSKAVDTPYSSVRKTDTRIQNNVYTPAVKTTSYAAPLYTQATPVAVTKSFQPAAAIYAAPAAVVAKTVYAAAAPAPLVAKTLYSTPVVTKSYAPAPAVAYAAPVVAKTLTYAAPALTQVSHGPAASTYSHNAPALGVSSYGSSQTVHYSPAESVSHMSFDGFGTHWGF
ncbi:CG8543 [Drosophila busckii]|uniref:CG8543 n=1 Tax=Drosophila busckii TaxID=30019 RepID=A0A0M4E8R1_DROBS|nr:cuticle protein 16.5 [Drosophila busckii]ALC43316.1 CG8543 [Drosophila busckii]